MNIEPDQIEMMSEIELRSELRRAAQWQLDMKRTVNKFLSDDDGTNLIPDHVRVGNMLERLSAQRKSNQH
jgi:hypothetical protein